MATPRLTDPTTDTLRSFQEFRSLFLHQFASSRKYRNPIESLLHSSKRRRITERLPPEVQHGRLGSSIGDPGSQCQRLLARIDGRRLLQEERSRPRTLGNDALVITALLANYEIERVFIDSGSSAAILFGEAYDQMQLGDVPLEAVNTSLYGFAGEVVHPKGMILLPLTLGTSHLRKTYLLKFLVVDIPSAYNWLEEWVRAHVDALQARKCYVEAIKRGKKRVLEEAPGEENSNKQGKDPVPRPEPKEEAPVTVQLVEDLLTVKLIPGYPGKVTKIESKMKEDVRDQVINCLQKNKDIFAWTPQDLEGIDPGDTLYLYIPSTSQAISYVLVREEDNTQTPIYYVSKVLNRAESRYPTIEKMAMALVITARKLRPYFLSYPVGVRTNIPLKQLQDRSSTTQGSGSGVVITTLQGDDMEFAIKFNFKASNNEAEYEAPVLGMRMAQDTSAVHLLAYSDSQRIVKQVNGE
ncbi:UNVERIFIED_CONTAM: hypothetical protein Sradi_1761600 [Sesamum radiatum]|uniref:Reverse transcriptase/retrotransposon-derived protein RNase H-like domain-containing protein n=1 Tax=Sesamum radiatum TaxID=300843 RepID=A0AAW2TUQ6_SESRA